MAQDDTEKRWLVLYRNAVREPDPTKLKVRIAQAQRVIRERARELWYSGGAATPERRELHTALRFLRLLLVFGPKVDRKAFEDAG
jgi:hypothetical protein